MQSVHFVAGAVQLHAGRSFVYVGIESMTRVPASGYNFMPHPVQVESYPVAYTIMRQTAENLARRNSISREAQDEFAVRSHAKAEASVRRGFFDQEIVPVRIENLRADRGGCIRPGTSLEARAGLKPTFDKDGAVIAGTSSALTDGVAAVLVCSQDYARARGLRGLAKLKSTVVAGCATEIMGIGPAPATRKALERAGMQLPDMDNIELNEAFAAQTVAVIQDVHMDGSKINLDGGAIAPGHPLGAPGARITGKLVALLKRERRKFGLATQCIEGGRGIATILQTL